MSVQEKKTAWFTAFRYIVPSDYEKWFEEQSACGWHPIINQGASMRMTFTKGEPKKYRYVVDLQAAPSKEYRRTFEDFGWEFLGNMASSWVWRKEYINERPQAFSDAENIRLRNKRFLIPIGIMALMFIGVFIVLAVLFPLNFSALNGEQIAQFILGLVLSGLFGGYMGWVAITLIKNMNR